jgi:hypothetical protein
MDGYPPHVRSFSPVRERNRLLHGSNVMDSH